MHSPSTDLFRLQTELMDTKIETAVNSKLDRVVEQLIELRHEMNQRFSDVEKKLTAVEHRLDRRLVAVETKLGIRERTGAQIRNKTIECVFKAGWLLLASIVAYIYLRFHIS